MTISVLAAAITALTSTAASEAGKTAWTALVSLVRNRFGHHPAADATAAVTSADPDTATRAAEQLLAVSAQNPNFGGELRHWYDSTVSITQGNNSVANVITGNAEVGKAFQGRDNHGTINL